MAAMRCDGLRRRAADHQQGGLHEIPDGRAFAQELGIGDDGDEGRAAHFGEHDLFAGAGVDGAAHGDDQGLGAAGQRGGDFLGDAAQLLEPEIAVLFRGRAHADERHVGVGEGFGEGDGGRQAPRGNGVAHQIFQAGLEERSAAGEHAVHLERVAVHAHHAMAEMGQAGGGDAADIAEAQHGDLLGLGGLLENGLPVRNWIHAL